MRKWISLFLAALMLLTAAVPAWAAEGQEAPPAADGSAYETGEAAPLAEEAPPAEVYAGEGDYIAETDAPVAAAAEGVTVSILGAAEQIEDIYYDAPDGSQCGYNEIYGGTGMDQVKVVDGFYQTIGQVDNLPGTLAVMPGSTVRFYLNASFDLAVENGTVTDNYVHSTPVSDGEIVSFRGVDVTAPAEGTLTITVTGSDQPAPETIPYTFYNYKWYGYEDGGILGDGSVIDGPEEGKQYAFSGDGWITTGGSFEVWTAPGYEIQVLEGGSIVEQRAPSGPAAASVPAGSTCYVVHVDLGAEAFAIACVKQGESFAPEAEAPETTAADGFTMPTGGVPVTVSGPMEAVNGISVWAPGGGMYDNLYNLMPEGVYTCNDLERTMVSASRPTAFDAYPGTEMLFELDPAYTLAVTGATTAEKLWYDTMADGTTGVRDRDVYVYAPESGSVAVQVVPFDGAQVRQVPLTEYLRGENGGFLASTIQKGIEAITTVDEDGTCHGYTVTGTVLSFQLRSGWTVQVLEGGQVIHTGGAWCGPTLETDYTCVDVQVSDDAQAFTFAVVKQGETFIPPTEHPATGTFKDVPDDSWYKDVVETAYASGMITGTSEDTFSPGAAASRGQTVAMLYRQAGSPSVADGKSFGDLTADYYKGAVDWASAVGAVNGTSDSAFSPDSAVSREQLAVMLYRMAGQPGIWSGSMMEDYSDAGSVSEYARSAMQWALDYGIIKGYEDGTIRPSAAADRAEVCAMVMRYKELVGMFPTEPVVAETEPESTPVPTPAPVKHTGRNLDNPKLIKPKREKIDDGIYSNDETEDQFYQQWSETFWGLDRSGEDIMWCLRNLTRIRSGPGDSYPVVATLYATCEVSRLGPDENGWTPVVYHEYETGEGFTGWDYTGYVRTDKISSVRPCHTRVADFSSGPALKAWCDQGGVPEGDMYFDCGATANGTFYHEEYTPVIDGDTYTYTLRGGGKVTIHNVIPEGLVSVEASGEEELHSVLLFVYLQRDYGIKTDSGYNGGYGMSPSGDYMSCEICFEMDMSNDENVDMTMYAGDEAPHLVQVTVKDSVGGSYMGSGGSRFVWVDKNGSWTSDYGGENFITLRPGYKLKSASPYVSIGTVSYESHFFYLNNVPRDVDQVYVEVTR